MSTCFQDDTDHYIFLYTCFTLEYKIRKSHRKPVSLWVCVTKMPCYKKKKLVVMQINISIQLKLFQKHDKAFRRACFIFFSYSI